MRRLVAAVGLAAAALAFAPAPGPVLGGDGDASSEPGSELEGPEARAALESLEAHLKLEEWPEAFAVARDVLEKHAEELVLGEDAVLIPARTAVRRKLAALPADGRAALEKLFGEEARRSLDEADALPGGAALEALGDRFFPLEVGGDALLLAGDRAFEQGSVLFAVAAWHDVARHHPDPERRAAARKRLDSAQPLRRGPAEDLSVDASGNVAPIVTADPRGTRAVFVPLHPEIPPELDWRDHGRARRLVFPTLDTEHAALGGVGPNGDPLLLVDLGRALRAFDATTHALVWAHEDRELARHFLTLGRARVTQRFAVAAGEGRVFATLQTDPVLIDTPRGKLVALDARTGKLLWDTLDAEWDEKPAGEEEERDPRLSFVGTPLPAGARVFCGATGASQPTETWTTACDEATGRVLWRRRLAVSPSPMRPMRGGGFRQDGQLVRLPAPSFGIVQGTLVVCSNNGVIEALDPASGRVLWAREYERTADSASESRDYGRTANPVLDLGGLAFVIPSDSERVLVLEPENGALVAAENRGEARRVLGVYGGRVLLCGANEVFALELTREGRLECPWRSAAFREVGRGLLLGGRLLVPTDAGVEPFDPLTGELQGVAAFHEEREEGDLLLVGGKLVSVGVRTAAFWSE